MSETVTDGAAAAALAQVRVGIDLLLSLDRSRFGVADALAVIGELEVQRRRLEAVDHDGVAHLVEADAARSLGAANTASLLVGALRITAGEAAARVRAAQTMGPRRALTGEPLAAEYTDIAAAQRAGQISAQHAKVITATVKQLPASLRAEHAGRLEASLVEHARVLHPVAVGQLGQRALAHLDPDGAAPREEDHARQRDVRLSPNSDGSGTLTGRLTPACLALAQAALGALSAPRPSADNVADARSAGQRMHDGFEDALRRLLTDGGLPDTGGTPTTLLVTLTLGDLEKRTGTATTGHGGTLSVPEALRVAADAEVIPVLFTDTGGVISYGRGRRTATAGQRRAMAARDKGCSMPGCDRPPAWCQTHHITEWIQHGDTDINTMTLLCGHHHRTFKRSGWECQMIDQVPHWRPPAWIDRDRRPLRNTAHL